MTGFTDQVLAFDKYLTVNYNLLLRQAKRQLKTDIDETKDILQTSIINLRERIARSGFTTTNYSGFLWVSNSRTKNRRRQQESKFELLDEWLQFNDVEIDEDNTQEYFDQLDELIELIYEYLARYFESGKVVLFKAYFTDATTYKEIAKQSGYKLDYVSSCICAMKKDLRTNLLHYIEFKKGRTKVFERSGRKPRNRYKLKTLVRAVNE